MSKSLDHDYALVVRGLHKSYSDFQLGPIDFNIPKGTMLGFVGANGSGKTTTIRGILGLTPMDQGRVEIAGKLVDYAKNDWKQDIGFSLLDQPFFQNLTVDENLAFYAKLYRRWDKDVTIRFKKKFRLEGSKKICTLSSGQKQQVAFLSAVSHRPSLLIMDEPTSNVDPVVRAEILEAIAQTMASGESSILMSSHIFKDLTFADYITIVRDGSLIRSGPKDDFLENWRKISIVCRGEIANLTEILTSLSGVQSIESRNEFHLLTTDRGEETLAALKDHPFEILGSTRIDLEDITLTLLQKA
jgi:ABC-2 type transport system ATP-binding protein